MKHLFRIAVLVICFTSCQRDATLIKETNKYLEKVKVSIKDSLTRTDFSNLDFDRAVQSRINRDTSYLRIPFFGKSLNQEFVLIQTGNDGIIKRGRMIAFGPRINTPDEPTRYDRAITIRTLKSELIVQSRIIDGFIETFQAAQTLQQRSSVVPNPYVTLPEVVVVGYTSSGTISFGDYIYLQGLFSDSYTNYDNTYVSMDGSPDAATGGGGGTAGSPSGGGEDIVQDPPIQIDFEGQQYHAGIDLQKYLNCFGAIPDAGAICTIEILSDIPVDSDPNKFFNFDSESPGHVFLQLKKTNGGQSVMQNIGFYPETNWKVLLTPAPVKGKFVDNGRHEYNASLKMTITPAELQNAIIHMQYLARFIQYDIDDYNCTDFALEVFNKVRNPAGRLEIPRYDIPGGMAPAGTSTPQGLYNKLKSMQQSSSSEASNISVPGYKGWVAISKGPCN